MHIVYLMLIKDHIYDLCANRQITWSGQVHIFAYSSTECNHSSRSLIISLSNGSNSLVILLFTDKLNTFGLFCFYCKLRKMLSIILCNNNNILLENEIVD